MGAGSRSAAEPDAPSGQIFSDTETGGTHTLMPRTMTHIPGVPTVVEGDGDGAGAGWVGDGAGEGAGDGAGAGAGAGAGPGAGLAGDVGAGRGFPEEAGCPGPGETLATATGWTGR
jgi:hypothetical protein